MSSEKKIGEVVPFKKTQLQSNQISLYEELTKYIEKNVTIYVKNARAAIAYDYPEAKGAYNKHRILYQLEEDLNKATLGLECLGVDQPSDYQKEKIGEVLYNYELERSIAKQAEQKLPQQLSLDLKD